MTVSEKVAYLKGLAEGMGIDENAKEGKILKTVIDILEDVALEIEDLNDGLDIVSEDLSDVEELLFDEDEDDECGDACCCGDEDEDYEFEVECPSCGETAGAPPPRAAATRGADVLAASICAFFSQ